MILLPTSRGINHRIHDRFVMINVRVKGWDYSSGYLCMFSDMCDVGLQSDFLRQNTWLHPLVISIRFTIFSVDI
jgi:hypothetical protein